MKEDEEIEFEDKKKNIRKNVQRGFKPVENTKEYAETTYDGLKNEAESTNLIPINTFWAELANHFI